MKNKFQFLQKRKLLTFGVGLLFPALSFAQATSSVMIPFNNKSVQVINADLAQIDLIKEIGLMKPALKARPIEIQMLRVEAKSSLGGAQIFLKINSDFMASAVVETNPDDFLSADLRTFSKFELKNIDRTAISAAAMVMQNFKSLKVNSIEVIMGAVQEPAVFGRYAQQQIETVGGLSENRSVKPTAQAIQEIRAKHYGTNTVIPQPVTKPPVVANKPPVTRPAVVAKPPAAKPSVSKPSVAKPAPKPVVTRPQVKPAPKPASNSRCLVSASGRRICVGDTVPSAFDYPQEVVGIDVGTRSLILTMDIYPGERFYRNVDLF